MGYHLRMAKPRQHWLPAAVIGGFGDTSDATGRDAVVVVRRKPSGIVALSKASSVGYERGLYTLSDPPPGMDENRIDQVLSSTEGVLPAAIAGLESDNPKSADLESILDYVAALAARHPDHFKEVSNSYQARIGGDPLTGDSLRVARLQALLNALPQVRTWHWRIVESPSDAGRFILGDLGFTYLGQEQRGGRGIFVPLSPRVALLGFIEQRQGFASRMPATPMTVNWLNAVTWEEAPRQVYGHPAEKDNIASLGDPNQLRLNRLGPYRGNTLNLLDE